MIISGLSWEQMSSLLPQILMTSLAEVYGFRVLQFSPDAHFPSEDLVYVQSVCLLRLLTALFCFDDFDSFEGTGHMFYRVSPLLFVWFFLKQSLGLFGGKIDCVY